MTSQKINQNKHLILQLRGIGQKLFSILSVSSPMGDFLCNYAMEMFCDSSVMACVWVYPKDLCNHRWGFITVHASSLCVAEKNLCFVVRNVYINDLL